MMDTPITRAEHEEFKQRMEAEHKRQDKRLEMIEDNISQIITRQITTMTTMIEKLALNVEGLLKEQTQQQKRLEVLENRDGEMWRKVVGYAVTAVVGIVLGFIATKIGL